MKELSLYWKQVHTVLDSIYVYSVTLNRVAQTLKSDKIHYPAQYELVSNTMIAPSFYTFLLF
jgi:hypothetical protein